jgi:hypothetical protein
MVSILVIMRYEFLNHTAHRIGHTAAHLTHPRAIGS